MYQITKDDLFFIAQSNSKPQHMFVVLKTCWICHEYIQKRNEFPFLSPLHTGKNVLLPTTFFFFLFFTTCFFQKSILFQKESRTQLNDAHKQ